MKIKKPSTFWAQGAEQLEKAALEPSPRVAELERLIEAAEDGAEKKALEEELHALRSYHLEDDSKALFLNVG